MISVIVPTLNAELSLPRCFDCLIVATVRGIVREVIVADGGSSDGTLTIADGAGAHIKQGGASRASQLIAGAAAARQDWLLFLHPETALDPGWENEVEGFITRSSPNNLRAASFRYGLDDFSGGARTKEALAAIRCSLFNRPHGDQGLLIAKRHYLKTGGYRDVRNEDRDLVSRLGAGRLVMLRSRAVHKTPEPVIAETGA